MNSNNKINVYDVTNYLIRQIYTCQCQITNMKINKLLYYIQGYYVAKYDKFLFEEPIEAWMFGPVIPHIYGEFFEFVDKPIDKDYICQGATNNEITQEAKDIIEQVIQKYANLDAYKLSVQTHKESPWQQAYNPRKKWKNNIITLQSLKDFFKNQKN
ncbi:Panacea domain-containing protein ['Camptotheca acuminata' phytoplasma]|uniref:Panacea domain-containing protein n=1 Tax='Camptotheca acuminata' phytoplasma TaxID=3239192 RepID=UPI00351A4E9D